MFKDIEPWRVTLREETIIPNNIDELITEMMSHHFDDSDAKLDGVFSIKLPGFTKTKEFVEKECIPRMLQYVNDQFQCEQHIDYWNSWVRNDNRGEGIGAHHHKSAHVSAVYYLEANDGFLTLLDPRGVAGRAYPNDIFDSNFVQYNHKPYRGCLIIFPSYLIHYVQAHTSGLRLALPIDVFLRG